MMKTPHILLAGATGYLGRYIARQLVKENYKTRLIVRDKKKAPFSSDVFDVVEAQVTQPASIEPAFAGIDCVISTVGITRQRDGLTYMEVDYQANVNLIEAAKRNGVRKFIYVSVFRGEALKHLKICEAKEKLVDYLKASGLDYCIIRPNGFFSDMLHFLTMAQKGRIHLFGDGSLKLNPIHGADLAEVCVAAITAAKKEVEVGGPEVLSQHEIAALAFRALDKKIRIRYLPDWLRKVVLVLVRTLTSSKLYGPVEFFLTVIAKDNIAPRHGTHYLKDFFQKQTQQKQKANYETLSQSTS